MKPAIGVVGLGIMGGAMAEALLEQGYRVCGFDVARAPLQRLKKGGGEPLASAAAVAERADIVITALATIRALDVVAEQLAAVKRDARRPRLVVVEMSTLPLE
ncbi:MAG: NAD(P)-binding domain-containing protein, partial [Burkholderiales bacterium]